MKKVVVFGSQGFAGKALCRELEEHGYKVCRVAHCGKKGYNVDIADTDSVYALIAEEKPDYVVNLAAVSAIGASWEHPQMAITANVIGSVNVMEAVRRMESPCKVLLVGSSEEYETLSGDMKETDSLKPRNIYGLSKLWQEQIAELYVKQYGISVICVRAFNHTGRDQSTNCVIPSFCKQIADIQNSGQDGKMFVGNLDVQRDILDVRDVASAYRMLLESEIREGIFNVCRGKAYTLREMLNEIIAFSDFKVDVQVDTARVRKVDIPIVCGDNCAIYETVGWQPKWSVGDMLKDIYEYYLKNGEKE